MEDRKAIAFVIVLLGALALIAYLTPGDDAEKAPAPEPVVVLTPEELEHKMVEAVVALHAEGKDLENHMALVLSTGGPVIIEMMPEKAPNHVARFKELAREGFYDSIVFHRVIEGFMAQTGDPTGTGSGGSGVKIDAEFNDVPHVRGVVSTARAEDPDSADSQFFIMLEPAPHLDGQYTAWGRVISGMEFIDGLARGERSDGGVVPEDLRGSIVSMQVAADVELP
jgi:peptidylprolyl isomerase